MFEFARNAPSEPVRAINPPPVTSAIDRQALVRVVRRSLKYALPAGLLCAVAAWLILGQLTPVYTSRVQIVVDPTDLRVVDNEVNARAPQADSGISAAETQVRVIQSDNVLRRVVEKLRLDQDREFNPQFVAGSSSGLRAGLPPADADPNGVAMAIETLQSKLLVRRAERTFVIDVFVRSSDAQKAALIANAVGDAFFEEESAARTDAAKRASDSLEGRLTSLRRDVERAERAVVNYREKNHLVASSGRLLTDQQLSDLNQQIVSASIKTAEAKSRLDQALQIKASDPTTALPEMLQSPEMQGLRQQYANLSRATAELSQQLGARHPAMADQQAQLRDVARQIQRERERIVDNLKWQYGRAVASEAAIRKGLDAAKGEVSESDYAYVGLRELERTLDARRTVYESYLRRAREASEQERLNTANVRIISAATPARQKSFPPSPKKILPVAFLFGVMLGIGIPLASLFLRKPKVGPRPVDSTLRAA